MATLHGPTSDRRASRRAPLVLAVLAMACHCSAAQPLWEKPPLDEYRVKANYLYSLGKFITWANENALRGIDSLNICVYGDSSFGNHFDRLAGLAVKRRAVVVRHIAQRRSALGCQILFVPGDALPRQLSSGELAAAGVLTVGENEEFLRHGGLVSLLASDNAVHIALNYRDAKRAGFVIDAGLLEVAKRMD